MVYGAININIRKNGQKRDYCTTVLQRCAESSLKADNPLSSIVSFLEYCVRKDGLPSPALASFLRIKNNDGPRPLAE